MNFKDSFIYLLLLLKLYLFIVNIKNKKINKQFIYFIKNV